MKMPTRTQYQAFSLIELSVVLIIIALIAGAGIGMGSSALKSADRIATQEKLLTIKSALNLFAQQNGYLPCPGDRTLLPTGTGFGDEKRTASTSCNTASGLVLSGSTYIGAVPVRTLGLPDSYAADSWNNKLTYAASSALVAGPGSYGTALSGGLVIRYGDRTNYQVAVRSPVGSGTPGTGYAAFVVVSHGPDARGAYPLLGTSAVGTCGATTADSENCNNDNIFADSKYFDGTQTAQFSDDFIVWDSNTKVQTPPATNVYRTRPVGCANVTAATPYCEEWCAPCTNNYPIVPSSLTNPILCSKILTPTSITCTANCVWSGIIIANSKYQPCP